MKQFQRALVVIRWGDQGLSLEDLLYIEAQGYPRTPGERTACFTVDQAQITTCSEGLASTYFTPEGDGNLCSWGPWAALC